MQQSEGAVMNKFRVATQFKFSGKVINTFLDRFESKEFGRHYMVWMDGYLQLHVGWLPTSEQPPKGGLMQATSIKFTFSVTTDDRTPETKDFGTVTAENFEDLQDKFVSITGYMFFLNVDDVNEVEFIADSIEVL